MSSYKNMFVHSSHSCQGEEEAHNFLQLVTDSVLFFSKARIVTRGGSVELQIHEHAQEVSVHIHQYEWFLFKRAKF